MEGEEIYFSDSHETYDDFIYQSEVCDGDFDRWLSMPEIEKVGNQVQEFDCQDPIEWVYNKYGYKMEFNERGISPIIGYEVGDDRVDFSNHKSSLFMTLYVQEEIMGMKTSLEDTFVSNRLWNFCEVTSVLPSSKTGSFNYARKNNSVRRTLEYVDSIISRLYLDVSKGDGSHSSSRVGKAQMLGSRMNCRQELKGMWDLASHFQDGCLRTIRSEEPKYLPRILGGSGCPIIFGNSENLYLYMVSYKGGGYSRLYGTAIEEARRGLTDLESERSPNIFLCQRLRDKQEYYYGTYASEVMIPKEMSVGVPIYEASTTSNAIHSVENRLVRSKLLVGEKNARIERAREIKLREALIGSRNFAYLNTRERQLSQIKRRDYLGALFANTAFKNLIDRTANGSETLQLLETGSFIKISCGVLDMTLKQCQWLVDQGGRSENFRIEDLYYAENMYIRDEVSIEESLKVPNIELSIPQKTGEWKVKTSSKVGLYEISQSMLEWGESHINKLREIREENPEQPINIGRVAKSFATDLEWVNDDTFIVESILRDTADLNANHTVAIVTLDRKLCLRACRSCGVTIIQLDPEAIIKELSLELINSETVISERLINDLASKFNYYLRYGPVVKVYLDLGSLASAASNMEVTGHKFYRISPIYSGNAGGARISQYKRTILPGNNPFRETFPGRIAWSKR